MPLTNTCVAGTRVLFGSQHTEDFMGSAAGTRALVALGRAPADVPFANAAAYSGMRLWH